MRIFLLLAVVCSAFCAEEIQGFWKSMDDDGKPQCIFGIYEHEGVHYGKIIGTYNDQGEMLDTIYKPVSKAAGVPGNPHTCGLDIVYGLVDNGWRFVGKVIDPSAGKTYNCEMWRENDNLILRGKLLIFGRNVTWYSTTSADFPKGFKLPDLKKLTPSVPNL